jgi:hypothetical protein
MSAPSSATRAPITTSTPLSSAIATRRKISDPGVERSASKKPTVSAGPAKAASRPCLTASAFPALAGRTRTATCAGRWAPRARSAASVPSVEPSSTSTRLRSARASHSAISAAPSSRAASL